MKREWEVQESLQILHCANSVATEQRQLESCDIESSSHIVVFYKDP